MSENVKKIAIGCDHAAYDMKLIIMERLEEKGFELLDVGTNSTESCDYPDYAKAAARKVVAGEADRAILICGSGVGMGMAANRIKGARAVVCTEPYSAYLSRLHNNSNVLCFGARLVGRDMAWEIVRTWIDTKFEGGRHERRVALIDGE